MEYEGTIDVITVEYIMNKMHIKKLRCFVEKKNCMISIMPVILAQFILASALKFDVPYG